MNPEIKEQISFVLDDDNELMQAALADDSDLDEQNKQMNRELIKKHEQILDKLDKNEQLNQEDLQLIRDANEIHLNDTINLNGRHKEAVELGNWLGNMTELSKEKAMRILEEHLDRDSNTPTTVYRALHTLWEEATPDDVVEERAFDKKGKCLRCGSKVSFADVTDTLVFVVDEIVKRHDGDITNRNCVRCTYPKQYPDYEDYDAGDDE
ncbi:hypothetical protein ACFL5Z_17025 [Planctomycetota bacterium]